MLQWKQALALVHDGHLRPIYTLVGTEKTLMERFIRRIQASVARIEGMAPDVQRFYCDDAGCTAAISQCQTVSLFAEPSVVLLLNCTGLTAQPKGKHDLTALETYAEAPISTRILVVTCDSGKLDERKKVVKALKKFPVVDCNSPKDGEALAFVRELAAEKGLKVAPDALAELWRRTQSVTVCERELEKLQAYSGGTVSLADIVEVTPSTTEDNVFRWVEGVVLGDLYSSFEALQSLQQSGYDAFALFSLLARQLRLMWYAKTMGQTATSPNELARRLGAHPYALKMAGQQARHMTVHKIETLLCTIADTEFAVKSGRRDVAQALDWIVLSCATVSATPIGRR